MKSPMLKSFRLRNFKAIRDSGIIKFTPLTVLVGNNGSGKSSLIEGLETYQAIVTEGLDQAMRRWHGFEYAWNQEALRKISTRAKEPHRPALPNPMRFELRGQVVGPAGFAAFTQIAREPGGNTLFIQDEKVDIRNQTSYRRHEVGVADVFDKPGGKESTQISIEDGESILRLSLVGPLIARWQFVSLVAQTMGEPAPQKRSRGRIQLAKDGSNIAEYLYHLRQTDSSAFEGLVETLQYVLPYARDLQPALTSELERNVYLQLTESDFKVPGWLLSTGTLRVLALLALLRHPTPPPLIVIEELENGLDPRTIHLVIEEIRGAVESGRTQVIATTHSPYLLDLLSLSHVVLVERIDGQPTFIRPKDEGALQEWAKTFGPGQLYTMGRLSRGETA